MIVADDVRCRFYAKVSTPDANGCMDWLGTRNREGYGSIRIPDVGMRKAHRVSYLLHIGPIPRGQLIDHRCHRPQCVAPEHLRLATRKQNAEHRLGAQADSSTGARGVYLRESGSYRVIVGHLGRLVHGGTFSTLSEATSAAVALRRELFTHNDLDRETQCA